MRVDIAVLTFVILAYSFYWVAFRPPTPLDPQDPCTVRYDNGDIFYYGKGTPCPSEDPCGVSECDQGTCTVLRIVPPHEFQADIFLSNGVYVTASVVNGGCKPITRVVSMTLACQSDDYDERKNATITVLANEAAVVTLPKWTDNVNKSLDCHLRYAGVTLNSTLQGPRDDPENIASTHRQPAWAASAIAPPLDPVATPFCQAYSQLPDSPRYGYDVKPVDSTPCQITLEHARRLQNKIDQPDQ